MPNVDQDCMMRVEEKVEAIREKALFVLQKEFTNLQYVVDPYVLDDYYSGQMDKPGVIYPHFRLPEGKSEEEIIKDIINNTRKYYVGRK